MKRKTISFIVNVGIYSALSAVLYFLRFPLPFIFPNFLEIQFSNLPLIIGGFILGPWGGLLILVVRSLITLPTCFDTNFVGAVADFIIGLAVVLSSSLIYKKNHTKKGGVLALLASSGAWIIIAVVANYFVLVPIYLELYFGGDTSVFVATCSIIPGINESNYMLMYILLAVVPFNLLISAIVNFVTFLVYKKISIFTHNINKEELDEKK